MKSDKNQISKEEEKIEEIERKMIKDGRNELGKELEIGLQIVDLIKIYKTKSIDVAALRGLSCNIYRNEITVIMGPSGSGKTTFLNILGGVLKPSSGKIIFNGEDICEKNLEELTKIRRKYIGYVFQTNNLIEELTAFENIKLPMVINSKSSKYCDKKANELIKIVKMEHRKNHKPSQLSGGEKQKISLAVALANNPEILLCDEPTGELDSDSKEKFQNIIRDILEIYPKMMIIIVTHDHSFKKIADRLYHISDGRVSYELKREDFIHGENKVKTISNIGKQDTSDLNNSVEELLKLKYYISNRIDKLKSNF